MYTYMTMYTYCCTHALHLCTVDPLMDHVL